MQVSLGVAEAHSATRDDAQAFVAEVHKLTRLDSSLNATATSGGFPTSSSCASVFG